jgi:uncharacterized protein YbjQ (UPF0145 family)
MIITTTNSVEGRAVQEYRGIVMGETRSSESTSTTSYWGAQGAC